MMQIRKQRRYFPETGRYVDGYILCGRMPGSGHPIGPIFHPSRDHLIALRHLYRHYPVGSPDRDKAMKRWIAENGPVYYSPRSAVFAEYGVLEGRR